MGPIRRRPRSKPILSRPDATEWCARCGTKLRDIRWQGQITAKTCPRCQGGSRRA